MAGRRKINFDDLQWERSYGRTVECFAYCQSKLADLMFALELGRRSASAGIPLVSNAAHPGFARTNLQSERAGAAQLYLVEKIMAAFISHDAFHGALPTLCAAAAKDAASRKLLCAGRYVPVEG